MGGRLLDDTVNDTDYRHRGKGIHGGSGKSGFITTSCGCKLEGTPPEGGRWQLGYIGQNQEEGTGFQ